MVSPVLRVPRQVHDPREQRVYLAWRGLALSNPPTLEPVDANQRVVIAARWLEHDTPYLQVVHPTHGARGDYAVRWLLTVIGRHLALLELAPGWPGAEPGPHQ